MADKKSFYENDEHLQAKENNPLMRAVKVVEWDILQHELQHLKTKNEELEQFNEWAKVQLDEDRQAFAKMEYGTPGRRPVTIKIHHETFQGWFLGWTVEQLPDNKSCTYALVEYRDGRVNKEYMHNINFNDWYTQELNEAAEEAQDDGDTDPTV